MFDKKPSFDKHPLYLIVLGISITIAATVIKNLTTTTTKSRNFLVVMTNFSLPAGTKSATFCRLKLSSIFSGGGGYEYSTISFKYNQVFM